MATVRTIRMELLTPVEVKIWDVFNEIEKLRPDERLTKATDLIYEALNLIEDYQDEQLKKALEIEPLVQQKEEIINQLQKDKTNWVRSEKIDGTICYKNFITQDEFNCFKDIGLDKVITIILNK